jgi:hypothetical protein
MWFWFVNLMPIMHILCEMEYGSCVLFYVLHTIQSTLVVNGIDVKFTL